MLNKLRFQILCLSGGGYFGLYTVSVIAELEKRYNRPIAKHFDLIAGTSIGGIIALALALEIPAEKIVEAFKINGERIFSNRPAPQTKLADLIDALRSLFKPKYQQSHLRSVLDEILGENTLLEQVKHPVIIPVFNVTQGQPYLFKTPHDANTSADRKLKVTEVALATSAAPIFFPLVEINQELYTDGGLFANAPDFLALHEAQFNMGIEKENIHLLSLGTATAHYTIPKNIGKNLSSLQWMKQSRILRTMISAQQKSTISLLKQTLGARYSRLDTELSTTQMQILGIDVANEQARQEISALVEKFAADSTNDKQLNEYFLHQAKYYNFSA